MEADGKPPGDDGTSDATRSVDKPAESGEGISPNERSARDAKGRFGKGNQAGVGHGRPKKDFDIETACMDWTPDIVAHFGYQGTIAQTGPQVEMGKAVLAYHLGKPRARLEHSGPGGGPIQLAAARTTEQKRARLRELQRKAAERLTTATPEALPPVMQDETALEGADPDDAPGVE